MAGITGRIGGRSLARVGEMLGGEGELKGEQGGNVLRGRRQQGRKEAKTEEKWVGAFARVASDCIESRQPGLKPLKLKVLNEIQSTTFLFSIRWVIFGAIEIFSVGSFIMLGIDRSWPEKFVRFSFPTDCGIGNGNGKLETRNWKLEAGLETRNSLRRFWQVEV